MINTPSVRRPHPHRGNPNRQRRERKTAEGKKRPSRVGRLKSIGPAPKARQYHTIIIQIYREGNKSSAVLRGSAARRCISIPMSDQGNACNPHWHKWHRQSSIERTHLIAPDLLYSKKSCNRSTMFNVTLKHTPNEKTGRCESAAEHRTAVQ